MICGGQKVYPVYVSFGNLDKAWRRKPSKHGMYLLGYLPIDSFKDIAEDENRRRLKAELVHRAMEKMFEPLRKASEEGVEMWCPDGRLRRIFPRIAAYTADWPEQNLQGCTSEGSCPVCKTSHLERGSLDEESELRKREETLDALRKYMLHQNIAHLKPLGLKPVWPWWGDIPELNLSTCFTPDLLHQAYQGVFKSHIVKWMKHIIGADVLDERLSAMPQAEGLMHFAKGITLVGQWTGRQSKQLLAQFLPAVIGGLNPPELGEMVRVLVDFIYRSHASSLTEWDLRAMEDDLKTFHQLKELLVVKGFYTSESRFNQIPKLHMLRHWVFSIRELGTPDGYNTEAPEHLHIKYAKVPWRASNKVRPLEQMVIYIQRQDAIRMHRRYLEQYLGIDQGEGESPDASEYDEGRVKLRLFEALNGHAFGAESRLCHNAMSLAGEAICVQDDEDGSDEEIFEHVVYPRPLQHMAKQATKEKQTFRDLIDKHKASNVIPDVRDFLARRLGVPKHNTILSPNNYVNIWHKIYLFHPPPSFAPFDPVRRDVVRARAPEVGPSGRIRQTGVWDVALYLEKPDYLHPFTNTREKHGINRYRAGRVRALFTLPAHLHSYYAGQLAYLELFEPFDASLSPFTKLYSTRPDYDSEGTRQTLVIPVTDIVFAAHLVPKFHTIENQVELNRYVDLLDIRVLEASSPSLTRPTPLKCSTQSASKAARGRAYQEGGSNLVPHLVDPFHLSE
ncbi:hypothetical protein BN14_10912 [Rhizoctonia solani AG-1 IB]|uniref:Uncharacterized protein n=1 Tax=Thanatephorus cucumeris (strain AG1-IB / isolate 7/3/14) TaxID=1108050 RepID=M5C9S1_THACB|nr:hypothetical protein BN14_10912 [Rhizoctonia solani AG-1 IB]